MSKSTDRAAYLAQAFKSACIAELEALKPGNVHIFADGHGMQIQDFLHSAEVAAAPLAKPGSTVGERILHAIQATNRAVGCNTNLGIVLLCAPLIHAAYMEESMPAEARLNAVLQDLTLQDAMLAFNAIKVASPAGLGASDRHDVHQPPQGTLLDAMREASEKDYIARQYANGYLEIRLGLQCYEALLQRWQRPAWAVSGLYLHFLASYPDSHIVRKYGAGTAEAILNQAIEYKESFFRCENPKTHMAALLKWDAELKLNGINPGTSADMTVATLLLSGIMNKTGTNSGEVSQK